MSLEFEKLLPSLDKMAQTAASRRRNRQTIITELLATLNQYAEDWATIENTLERAKELADPKHYRAARPLTEDEPLNAQINAPVCPSQATLIATDGSQIMPDRHAAHLYYLINIGGLVYYHGDGRSPEPFSDPQLIYPADDKEAAEFAINSSVVGIERDVQEIGTLAQKAWALRDSESPLLALLDQRLLYWPIGGPDAGPNEDVKAWLAAMTRIHDSQASLAGYIDRPMTGAVITLLLALAGKDDPDFDWKSLGKYATGGGLTDAVLFSQILEPGQRSKIFVGISPPNERFAEFDPGNEVCFFYLNPGQTGRRIARVDIPLWVAKNPSAVTAVHALIYDQCRILGDYPYILARADEMAVIGHQDHEELNFMIDLHMQRYGVENRLTAKQSSKEIARGGKTRHEGL